LLLFSWKSLGFAVFDLQLLCLHPPGKLIFYQQWGDIQRIQVTPRRNQKFSEMARKFLFSFPQFMSPTQVSLITTDYLSTGFTQGPRFGTGKYCFQVDNKIFSLE
jgi:hypothetical protein